MMKFFQLTDEKFYTSHLVSTTNYRLTLQKYFLTAKVKMKK